MRVEPMTPELVERILPWWELRGVGAMPRDILPPMGAVALDERNEPVAAGWLYEPHGCRVAMLDWLVTKPGLGVLRSRTACRLVIERLADMARAGGATRLFASVERARLAREAADLGFHTAASSCIHLIKSL